MTVATTFDRGPEGPATPDRSSCHAQWHAMYGRPPPKHLSTRFMERALAWEAQAKASGGLSAEAKRTLQSVARGRQVKQAGPGKASTGTHLVREWNGRTYQVEVLEQGFQMDGRAYRSLTAIAKRITGTNWSGPRFFGLNGR
jgi:hypothetical protein